MICRLVAVLGVLALAPPVFAHKTHVTRLRTLAARIAVAERIASAYWGGPACGGNFTVDLADLPPKVAIGQATYSTAPDGTFTGCRIKISRSAFGAGSTTPWWAFCTTFVHEEGHLHGFQVAGGTDGGHHSLDPRNVMYPGPTYVNTPPACFKYR